MPLDIMDENFSFQRKTHDLFLTFSHQGKPALLPEQPGLEICCVFRDSTISRLPCWLCLYKREQHQSFPTATLGCKGSIY